MVCMQDKTGGLVACREMPEHFTRARLYTDDTTLDIVKPELASLPRKALTWDATRRLCYRRYITT